MRTSMRHMRFRAWENADVITVYLCKIASLRCFNNVFNNYLCCYKISRKSMVIFVKRINFRVERVQLRTIQFEIFSEEGT